MSKRGWTAYRLAQETGIPMPTAYRIAKSDAIQRIDAGTLETLCRTFGVKPGALLELADDA